VGGGSREVGVQVGILYWERGNSARPGLSRRSSGSGGGSLEESAGPVGGAVPSTGEDLIDPLLALTPCFLAASRKTADFIAYLRTSK